MEPSDTVEDRHLSAGLMLTELRERSCLSILHPTGKNIAGLRCSSTFVHTFHILGASETDNLITMIEFCILVFLFRVGRKI